MSNVIREQVVNVIRDKEANVWVALSDDIPGLVTEAETLNELIEDLKILVPEMLHENRHLINTQELIVRNLTQGGISGPNEAASGRHSWVVSL